MTKGLPRDTARNGPKAPRYLDTLPARCALDEQLKLAAEWRADETLTDYREKLVRPSPPRLS
jgi:hypothetical protein